MLMTNFKIILAYNGTAYHGWQRQINALAIQQVLEEAILSLTGQTVTVNGCSRTDAGVHARRFCASFLIESTITCRGIVFGLNSKLPDDISVLECEKVPLDFQLFGGPANCGRLRNLFVFHVGSHYINWAVVFR